MFRNERNTARAGAWCKLQRLRPTITNMRLRSCPLNPYEDRFENSVHFPENL